MSISRETLTSLRVAYLHDRCADGLASGLILKDALPQLDLRFVQYKTQRHETLEPEPGVIFCDFTPANQIDAWVDAGAVVLDHHAGAEDTIRRFGPRGVYADAVRDPGVSGATLAFWEVWRPLCGGVPFDAAKTFLERFSYLAGVLDTWRTASPDWDEACTQEAALLFYPREDWIAQPLREEVVRDRLAIGSMLVRKRAGDIQRHLAEACIFATARHTVLVVATTETSHLAEMVRRSKVCDQETYADVDVVIGFRYLMDAGRAKIVLSCRSISDAEVLPFARSLGGSGHARAAGASLLLGPESREPYATIRHLFARYEAEAPT